MTEALWLPFMARMVTLLLYTIRHWPVWPCATSLYRRLGIFMLSLSLLHCAHRPQTQNAAPAQSVKQSAVLPDAAERVVDPSAAAPGAAADEAALPGVRPLRLGADANTQTLMAAAQSAFANRTDLAQLKFAIAQWERVHGLEPENANVALNLSRAYFLLGDSFYRSSAENAPGIMHDAFERGALAGEQALMLLSPGFAAKLAEGRAVEEALLATDKAGLEAMAWYAQNLTAFAIARGIPTMLLYRKRVQTLVEQMISRDETLLYGAAYRVRGMFMASAPTFAGGSLTQAQSAFARAQIIAPDYLPNALAFAEMWTVQAADKAGFVQTLTQIVQADARRPADVAPEQLLAQKRAQWLLTRVNRLF
jgi:hypothetical protein